MEPSQAWEQYGRTDPYYAVLTDERFREPSAEQRAEFFKSGETHISTIFELVREMSPTFKPERAFDFGCGVGRLLLPLARRVPAVTGLDVSESMLAEAKRNITAAKLDNVALLQTGDDIGYFDFLHSFIVFQHIPKKIGLVEFGRLLARLDDGGHGAVQFGYATRRRLWNHFNYWMRQKIPGANALAHLRKGQPIQPFMEMNPYPLAQIFRMLYDSGCHRVRVRFTEHSGFLGALLLFQKTPLQPL